MACPRCGATSPETSAGGLCNSCRWEIAQDEAAKRRKQEKEKSYTDRL